MSTLSIPFKHWTILLILAVALAACGGNDGPTPEATATHAPTTQPAPTATDLPVATAEAVATAPQSPVADPEYLPPGKVLKSFRSRSESIFSTTYADGTVDEEHAIFTGTFVLTDGPYGFDETFELFELGHDGDDAETPVPSMVIYAVGEGMAVRTGEQWSVTERDPLSQPSPAFEVFSGLPGDIANAIDQARSLGTEMMSGVATTHYRVDERAAFENMLNIVMDESEGEVQQLGYDVWIADEGQFVVKYDFVIQVANAQTTDLDGNPVVADEISVRWAYELSDINADITIEWPADAPRLGEIDLPGFGPGDFPMPPDTQIESTMFGIVTLVTTQDAESVTAFYEEALAELGWQMEGDGGFFNFTKEGTTLSMVIGPDEQGGTRVTVIPE